MKKHIFVSLIFAFSLSVVGYAEHWPTGYYQESDDPSNSYYYNDENRWYCHIQNPTQAGLYDVASQVRVVGDISGILGQSVSLEECPWPDGFYQIASTSGPVYRLYPGNICTVSSPEMLAAYGGTDSVIQTEDGSDFSAHRTDLGQCFWPSWDEIGDSTEQQH